MLLTNYLALSNAQSNATLDPSQVYTTGNLVTFDPGGSNTTTPWQNVGQWNGSLTCWAPGQPGYCGPNPYVGAFPNTINFSYGTADLYQVVNIANSLPYSGTGLRVNGFNFGFTAKNGNGWDDGRQDYLVAYVNFYGADGKLAQSYDYGKYTNALYGWTPFNFSETFATPYAAKDLSTARYGFVGRDNNFWAGPYGPEITGVSFNLKYSVDPCYIDVLSSPTCPGYLEKINSLTTPAPTATATTTTTTAPTTTSSSEVILPPNTSSTTTATTSPAPTAPSITVTTATPTALDPKPRVGSVATAGERDRASVIVDTIRKEQNRISTLEATVVETAVSQAQQQSQQAQEQSIKISAATVSQSQATAQTAAAVIAAPITMSVQSSAPIASVSIQSSVGIRINEPMPQFALRVDNDNNAGDGLKLTGTGPLANFVNPSRTSESQPESAPGPAVNTQARDNDAAGGVSIAAMARTPVGFESYMGIMPDTKFYDPKEIYRGQRVVDNARVQRALSGASDRLHQEMVDQQYRRSP